MRWAAQPARHRLMLRDSSREQQCHPRFSTPSGTVGWLPWPTCNAARPVLHLRGLHRGQGRQGTVRGRFGDRVSFDAIMVVPRTDQWGDESVHLYVVYDGDGEPLDAGWLGGLRNRMRRELRSLGVTGVVTTSYIDRSELDPLAGPDRERPPDRLHRRAAGPEDARDGSYGAWPVAASIGARRQRAVPAGAGGSGRHHAAAAGQAPMIKIALALLACLHLLVIARSSEAPNVMNLCNRQCSPVRKFARWLSNQILDRIVVCLAGMMPLLITGIAALDCQLQDPFLSLVPDQLNKQFVCRCNQVVMWTIFGSSSVLVCYLFIERLAGKGIARMRHAIAILALLGLAITSVSIYGWNWLNQGDSPNSETIQHIALGVAVLLTVIFVIWRERIASGKATSDRYANAVQMLSDPNAATQIAGIRIIRDLGRYSLYQEMGLAVLQAFVNYPPQSHLSQPARSRRAAVQEAKYAIDRLCNNRSKGTDGPSQK